VCLTLRGNRLANQAIDRNIPVAPVTIPMPYRTP
jgi:hypothetical protein